MNKVKTLEQFFADFIPSNSDLQELLLFIDNDQSLNIAVAEQLKIEHEINKQENKNGLEEKDSSDEESRLELRRAVKEYRKNKKLKETESGEPKKCEKANTNVTVQRNLELETNSSKEALADIKEFINYLFLPSKNQENSNTVKSYAEYEKQGAIPKGKKREDPIETDKIQTEAEDGRSKAKGKKKAKKVKEQTRKKVLSHESNKSEHSDVLGLHSDKIDEKSSEPFFYIVPENPSPSFTLPKGSYYIIPKVPGSQAEEKIVFHPETTDKQKKDKPGNVLAISDVPAKHPPKLNNLNKDVLQRRDTHLNIGPSDASQNDIFNNLETNVSKRPKYFPFTNSVESASFNGSERSIEILVEEKENPEGVEVESNQKGPENNDEKLSEIVQRLSLEFPDISYEVSFSVAERYLNNDRGLENFIVSERLTRKIQNQFERLVLALPEMSFSELREKCIELQGNETLLDNYIEEQRHAEKVRRIVVDLQHILPDADPDFLQKTVEELKGDENNISILTTNLLEKNDYPKMKEDPNDARRRSLWKTYVMDFNVKNYTRAVANPEVYEENTNNEDQDLILKFLKSRYPMAPEEHLLVTLRNQQENLTKTCDQLSAFYEAVSLAQSSFQREVFSESFLKELCFIEHKKEIKNYLKELRERKAIEEEDARLNDCFLSCPLCSEDRLVPSEVVTCPDGHVFCEDCIKRYIQVKISDAIYKFACPLEACETFFTLNALEDLLPESTVVRITQKQQAEELRVAKVDGLESCPFCEFAYIPSPADKIFKCQNLGCLIESCRKCHEKNHIPLRCEEVERPVDVEARRRIEEAMTESLVRTCPKCSKKFVRIDGCNLMKCTCGTTICYICRKEISGYNHFQGNGGICPLYSDNRVLHGREVLKAGVRIRDEILRENPNVHLFYDPDDDSDFENLK